MARIVILVITLAIGLWIVVQAINTKKMVERRHSNLITMMVMEGAGE